MTDKEQVEQVFEQYQALMRAVASAVTPGTSNEIVGPALLMLIATLRSMLPGGCTPAFDLGIEQLSSGPLKDALDKASGVNLCR